MSVDAVSDDIVSQLRTFPTMGVASQAADEIERLRRVLVAEVAVANAEIGRLMDREARAAEMIRIKDELISKQIARIVYLEGIKR